MIYVQLTNGFGNNLFQYNAAKLLADFLGESVHAIPPHPGYSSTKDLLSIGVPVLEDSITIDAVLVDEKGYWNSFDPKYKNTDIMISGYFEDYKYFYKNVERIKTYFPEVQKRNDNDLVVHLRAGDRLFYRACFTGDSLATSDAYVSAIETFDFDNLHIVTDMPKWGKITREELLGMKFHLDVSRFNEVSLDESVDYFNSIVEAFSKYNPLFKKRSVAEDFNFIRTFDNILLQHGTMSWWAAALSGASSVGVYGPWRPWKGVRNPNLADAPFDGWFKWQ